MASTRLFTGPRATRLLIDSAANAAGSRQDAVEHLATDTCGASRTSRWNARYGARE